jgi:hypothetical protein
VTTDFRAGGKDARQFGAQPDASGRQPASRVEPRLWLVVKTFDSFCRRILRAKTANSCVPRSLTDPDARSMATSGRGSGVVGYNVQVAVDTEYHLIVTHEVTNVGNDTAHLANMAAQAKALLQLQELEAVADRSYFKSEEIIARDQVGITVTLPKPTSRLGLPRPALTRLCCQISQLH